VLNAVFRHACTQQMLLLSTPYYHSCNWYLVCT